MVLNYNLLKYNPEKFLNLLFTYLKIDFPKNLSIKVKHKLYDEKQLKMVKNYGKYFGINLKPYSKNRFIRNIQRYLRMPMRYMLLYSAYLMPKRFIDKKPLIADEYLEQIKIFYKEDWQKVENYIDKQFILEN